MPPGDDGKSLGLTIVQKYVLDTCLAVVGILMFGDTIKEAITSNILKSPGYPKPLTIIMTLCIAIIPLTKIPLNARPIITTVDVLCGVHPTAHQMHLQDTSANPSATQRAAFVTLVSRLGIRLCVVTLLLVISIAFPAFDSVCAFLGAALCTLISVLLPISFYLKLYWKDITGREKGLLFALLCVFSIFGVLGTIWTFIPKHLLGL